MSGVVSFCCPLLCDGAGRAWALGYVGLWLRCTMLCVRACVLGIMCLLGDLNYGEGPLCYKLSLG